MSLVIEKTVKINTVEQWFNAAPPKRGKFQWKDGFSAKELARFATSLEFEPFIKKNM